jgi:hypothetical protein
MRTTTTVRSWRASRKSGDGTGTRERRQSVGTRERKKRKRDESAEDCDAYIIAAYHILYSLKATTRVEFAKLASV